MPDTRINELENRWITFHELRNWFLCMIQLYGSEDMLPADVARLFLYMVREASGTEGVDVFPEDYTYKIDNDTVEHGYSFFRINAKSATDMPSHLYMERFDYSRFTANWNGKLKRKQACEETKIASESTIDEAEYMKVIGYGD